MDLAAMLAQSEHAAEEGVQVLVFPRVPGLVGDRGLLDAFFRNVEERAPGVGLIRPNLRHPGEGPLRPQATALGRTLVLDGDDCIDPALFAAIQESACESLVWLFNAEDPLQAEASLELALDASLHLAPLVVIATVTGHARGVLAAGIGAIVHLGEILAEGGEGEELVVADVPSPAGFEERPRSLPEPAPILLQRLSAHRAAGLR
jgi:predicted amidohydrolase